jgi:hypothetical protein
MNQGHPYLPTQISRAFLKSWVRYLGIEVDDALAIADPLNLYRVMPPRRLVATISAIIAPVADASFHSVIDRSGSPLCGFGQRLTGAGSLVHWPPAAPTGSAFAEQR